MAELKLRAEIVPFSSVVGQGVMLLDETGQVVAHLSVRAQNLPANSDAKDIRKLTEAVAKYLVKKINGRPA